MRGKQFQVGRRSLVWCAAAIVGLVPSNSNAQSTAFKPGNTTAVAAADDDVALTCRTAPMFDLGIYAGGAWSCNWMSPQLGMDGGYFHNDAGEGTDWFLMPLQQIRVTVPVTPNFRFEIPLSLDYSKEKGEDASTSVGIGAIVDFLLRTPDSASIRRSSWIPFIGAGYALDYTKVGDESSTGNIILGRIGVERDVNDFTFRLAGVYRRLLEHDDIDASNEYGVTLGVGVRVRQDWGSQMIKDALRRGDSMFGTFTPGPWYFTGSMSVSRETADDVSSTSVTIPTPQVGLFYMPPSQTFFAAGLKTGITWASSGDYSARNLIFTPRVEINPFGHPLSATTPIQIGIQGIIDNISYDVGNSDVSGARTGVGGDISMVFKMAPSDIKIGIGYDRMFENEDLGTPSSNIIRFSVALDRYVLQRRLQKNNLP